MIQGSNRLRPAPTFWFKNSPRLAEMCFIREGNATGRATQPPCGQRSRGCNRLGAAQCESNRPILNRESKVLWKKRVLVTFGERSAAGVAKWIPAARLSRGFTGRLTFVTVCRELTGGNGTDICLRPRAGKGLLMLKRSHWACIRSGVLLCIVYASTLLSFGRLVTAADADSIEVAARSVLTNRCVKCHGKVNPQSGLNLLDVAVLIQRKVVVPKSPEQSDLWERVTSTDGTVVMPPEGRLTDGELDVLRRWIAAGAVQARVEAIARPRVTTAMTFAAIASDLRKAPLEGRRRYRYFSLSQQHNNVKYSDADLRMFRASLSKLINSLTWEPRIVIPVAVDPHQTVLRVDLAALGWERLATWNQLLTVYPYGLSFEHSSDENLRSDAVYVYESLGTRIPIVRADWFIATAAVPPLYHDILGLPDGPGSDSKLEEMLKVDVARNFRNNLAARAGFTKSNVSRHNRLVERHSSSYGAYWKSYDFGASSGRAQLTRFPLGPSFEGNEFERAAFQHDGGELIFNLPNGMQGYLLVGKDGGRIDRGPINVVFDSKKPLGNSEVINGISCMVCHVQGMQLFHDDIRAGHALTGAEARKVEGLFPPQEEMDKFLASDRDRFMKSVEQVLRPFLSPGELQRSIDKSLEPIGSIASHFSDDLALEDVLAEVEGLSPEMSQVLFRDRSYRKYGLGVLLEGGTLKRESWEKLGPYSMYQVVSEQLDIGTPERVFP